MVLYSTRAAAGKMCVLESRRAGAPRPLRKELSCPGHTYFSQSVNCNFFQFIKCISLIRSVVFFSTFHLESFCRGIWLICFGERLTRLRHTPFSQFLNAILSIFLSYCQMYFSQFMIWETCAARLVCFGRRVSRPGHTRYMGTRPGLLPNHQPMHALITMPPFLF